MANDKKITDGEVKAAQKLLKKYEEQLAVERDNYWDSRRQWLGEMAGDFEGNSMLKEWAVAKWKRDMRKGIGTKMGDDLAVVWYLKNLRNAVVDVCQAFNIPVEEIVNRNVQNDKDCDDAQR